MNCELLDELAAWCIAQPGAVTWLLFQTIAYTRAGRIVRGYQLLITDHEAHEADPMFCLNAPNLDELASTIAVLRQKGHFAGMGLSPCKEVLS